MTTRTRAMQVIELGAPLQARDVTLSDPGPGELLVQVRACGVNFADTLVAVGRYQEKRPLPLTPGMEIAATVEALGPGVSGFAKGQRIASFCGFGGFAEHAIVDADTCVAIPDAMPDREVAAFLIAYGTSDVALRHRAKLRPGETLLVLGASGGVGLTAVELGKVMGATVIASARGKAKLDVARAAGADHLLDSGTTDLREAVRALGGADVVYDPVGGAQFDAALRACKPEARLLPLGFASGDVPQVPANIILVKNLSVLGIYWGGYAKFAPEVLRESFAHLFSLYTEGRLHPHVSHVLPLEEANAALDHLRNRTATGKVVLTM